MSTSEFEPYTGKVTRKTRIARRNPAVAKNFLDVNLLISILPLPEKTFGSRYQQEHEDAIESNQD